MATSGDVRRLFEGSDALNQMQDEVFRFMGIMKGIVPKGDVLVVPLENRLEIFIDHKEARVVTFGGEWCVIKTGETNPHLSMLHRSLHFILAKAMERWSGAREKLEFIMAQAPKQPVTIVVTKMSMGFRAEVEGNPTLLEFSKISGDDAVGGLLRTHPETIGVNVRWNTENSWTARYVAGDPKTWD